MTIIRRKKVFGLGELTLQYAPGAYYLANISTHCIVCGQLTNRVAKNNINIKSCCEACFDKPEIEREFIIINKPETIGKKYETKDNVIWLFGK